MSTFHTAIQDFVAAVRHGPREQLGPCFGEVLSASEQAGPEEATWALTALVELLARPPGGDVGYLAVACTQCMIRGASPWVATGLVVERLQEGLGRADAFLQACRARAQAAGISASPESLKGVFPDVAREMPDHARSFGELDLLCMAAGPLLGHFAEARRLFRALGGNTEQVRRLAEGRDPVEKLAHLLEEHAASAAEPAPPGAAVEAALRRLAESAGRDSAASEEVYAALQGLMESLFCVDLATRNRALAGIGRLLADCAPGHAGELAQTCGSLVETGGDPAQAMGPILARLPALLRSAEEFLSACLNESPEESGEGEEKGPAELVQERGPQVAERLPAEAQAWGTVGPMCLGAIALLARSPESRQQVRQDDGLLRRARALAGVNGAAAFLGKMLQVLDGEELLILSPEPKVGFRVRIGGVGDNFQLHTLLAGAVIGPAEEGLFPGVVGTVYDGHAEPPQPGRPLDARAVGVARDLPCSRDEASVYSHLQLWTWKALRPDGRLPADPIASHDFFVWNEGVPADIPPFEGVRVILLGPVSFSRSWNGGRVFPFMTADLRVEEKLTPAAVADWLRRLAAASRQLGARATRRERHLCP